MSETLSAVQPTATPASTMAGVLQAMGQQQQSVPEDQRGLADRLKALQDQLENDPSLESDPKFATQIAWLVQDWPKFSGTGQAVPVSPLLHAGLNAMAGQYPGMSNPQVMSMLQQTAGMDDRQLVADIRNASVELGALPAEQQTSFLISAGVNALAARAAQTGVAPAPQPSPIVQPAPAPQPAAPEAFVAAPGMASESVAQTGPAVAQFEPSLADLGQREDAPSFVVAGDNEPTAEELAARGASPDYAAQVTQPGMETVSPVAASVVAESVPQAASQEAVGPGRPASEQDMGHDDPSFGHASMNVPFGDGDGAPSPRANETVDATRGEPEAQATQSAQEPSKAAGERTVQAGMSEDQEEDIRNRDMNNQQEAQNTPPEKRQQNAQKQPAQSNGEKERAKTNARTKDVEPEVEQEQQTPASAQAQPQTAQPAQAPVGSLAGHIVSKGVNVAKSWFANQAVASDQRRIDSLVATVDGNIRMADRHYQDLKQSAAPFFKKLEETAQQEGVKPAALMASMGEGGKHYGLWQEFTNLRMTDERVGKPYNDLATTLQDMRRNLGSLQSEAAERGATNAQSVTGVEERAGQKARDMEDVPGRNPGESLIKSIGGALERLMEKVKARFLALTQGREQGRDTSPSMGA